MRRPLAAASLALAAAFPCAALAAGLPPAGPSAIGASAPDPGAPVDVARLLGDPDAVVLSTHRFGGVTAMVVEHRTGRYYCQGMSGGSAAAAMAPYRCAQARKPPDSAFPDAGDEE